jgi:nucleoside-diphosphate-sugar epimerase
LRILVTGGAGYVGLCVVEELVASGHEARVLDVLLHGQDPLARGLEESGTDVVRADVRDAHARRRALDGCDAVVHLAAIVGDPACALDPALSHEVNVEGSRALADDAAAAGVTHLVFASTCSNYGRMADPTVPVDEDGELAPVSLYAEQKVGIERELLAGGRDGMAATCLRLATVYGVAPRMRFDLTVNEFTRDLWAGRNLEVFGEQFWRPYVHARDAARAIVTVVEAGPDSLGGQVFNVGHSDENYRKLDLVEIITGQLGRGDVSYVRRDEDPRDYKVSFEKVRRELGFEPRYRVPDGVRELVDALERSEFGDPFEPRYSNLESARAGAGLEGGSSFGSTSS